MFLSVYDRALFISRGKAVEKALTDRRLDRIISQIKDFLRRGDYGNAILFAIDQMERDVQKGEPNSYERQMDFLGDMVPIGIFTSILLFILFGIRRQRHEQRVYAQVESQLSRIDRGRAEALQGRYRCASCPICLEDFETTDDGVPKQGSDGLPVKLLRCGHVFDETCWNEWVSNGQGNLRRCPICQQDVGNTSESGMEQPQGITSRENRNSEHDETRMFRQFNRERNFRLARLGARYPRYVRSDMIQRWTQSTYDGSLARDRTFMRANPRTHDTHGGGRAHNGFSSYEGSSFGGGSSSGGRGGSW